MYLSDQIFRKYVHNVAPMMAKVIRPKKSEDISGISRFTYGVKEAIKKNTAPIIKRYAVVQN